MTSVFVPIYGEVDEVYELPLEGFILGFVTQWLTPPETSEYPLSLNLVLMSRQLPVFTLPKSCFKTFAGKVISVADMPDAMKMTTLPSILTCLEQLCISGLCSVIRYLFKSDNSDKCNALLGFRKGCLMACAEVSVWTKFCEIELLAATKLFLAEFTCQDKMTVPRDVCRFEVHLNEPLRTHNIGKKKYEVIKDMQKLKLNDPSKCDSLEKSGVSRVADDDAKENRPSQNGTGVFNPACVTGKMGARLLDLPILKHEFAESTSMTLADLIILVYVQHILVKLPNLLNCMPGILPGISQWYCRILSDKNVVAALRATGLVPLIFGGEEVDCNIHLPAITESNIFIRDPKSYSRRIRTFTNQNHIEAVFEKLKIAEISPDYQTTGNNGDGKLNWLQLPAVVVPTFGNLPESRFDRKCMQLENMASAVRSFARDGDVIVDFCSGGGHLGILLAHLLPNCRIVMVENKEESIGRALLRAKSLPNASIYQCNMAYFEGKFDIGVALHACGGATDLVLNLCQRIGAAFVICPCCYGSLHDTHQISYPLSDEFSKAGITPQEYYILGHAADQTHENGHKNDQGKYCMGLVDTDRGFQAIASGYKVSLSSMDPLTCSPKNNILVGIPGHR